jgi:hypothetical protein
MKKLILLLLFSTAAFSQPPKPKVHRACLTPNPPWWCGGNPSNPVPLPALPLFGLVVVGALGYTYYKFSQIGSKL